MRTGVSGAGEGEEVEVGAGVVGTAGESGIVSVVSNHDANKERQGSGVSPETDNQAREGLTTDVG